jgi:hypothetical protein
MGILWGDSALAFAIITVFLGGGAAWLSGASLARSWRPLWLALAYMVLLGAAVRFLHFSLAHGQLLSLHYFFVDTVLLVAVAALAYRIARTSQMAQQYPWLYRRTSPVTWESVA